MCADRDKFGVIFKKDENYYHWTYGANFFNSDFSKCIDIYRTRKINMERDGQVAVENTMLTICDDLSLGDKLIIRNIALEGFHNALETARDKTQCIFHNYVACVRTDLNEKIVAELREYGFQIRYPYNRIRDIKLN